MIDKALFGARKQRGLWIAVGVMAVGYFASAAVSVATAASDPSWRVSSVAATSVTPGEQLTYHVDAINHSQVTTDGVTQYQLDVSLPAGLTAVSASGEVAGWVCDDGAGNPVGVGDPQTVRCVGTQVLVPKQAAPLELIVDVASDAELLGQTVTTKIGVSGGLGSGLELLRPDATVDPTTISESQALFGLDAFDAQIVSASGGPINQAGEHPDAINLTVDFNTVHNVDALRGDVWPVAPAKDVVVDLPAGLIGTLRSIGACTLAQLANSEAINALSLCPIKSQIATADVRIKGFGPFPYVMSPVPVYNMAPPPGRPARFGLNVLGSVVVLDSSLRSHPDYGVTVIGRNLSQGLAVAGSTVHFWGIPGSVAHDAGRGCPGQLQPWRPDGASCPAADGSAAPFLRVPTSCTLQGLPWSVQTDSWFHPGAADGEGNPAPGDPNWVGSEIRSHAAPGYPYPPSEWGQEATGLNGCEAVPGQGQTHGRADRAGHRDRERSRRPRRSAQPRHGQRDRHLHLRPQEGQGHPAPGSHDQPLPGRGPRSLLARPSTRAPSWNFHPDGQHGCPSIPRLARSRSRPRCSMRPCPATSTSPSPTTTPSTPCSPSTSSSKNRSAESWSSCRANLRTNETDRADRSRVRQISPRCPSRPSTSTSERERGRRW